MRTITSERLILRHWEAEDADFLLDLESRWEVMRYVGASPSIMTSRDDALASIRRRRAVSEHPIHGIWVITDRAGRRLGNLVLKPVPLSAGESPSLPAEVEVGWHLHPDAWGNGYATEAAKAAVADAFSRGQHRLIAVTHPLNQPSQAVCRRAGMRHLGDSTRYLDMSCELFDVVKGL